MLRLRICAVAVSVGMAGVAALAASTGAAAEPAVPQPGAPCPESAAGALTQLPDLMTFLECRNQRGSEYRWQTFDSPYPKSDRWFTYGPQLTLHGEGQPNREIDSGAWVAIPQSPDAQCSAAQLDNTAAGERTPPEVSTGEPGQLLNLDVLPLLFTVELQGHCLWQKVH
jgi:hypothetical protein